MSEKALTVQTKTKKYKEYLKNMSRSIGMKPRNAAIVAGYAPKTADLLAGTEEAKKLFDLEPIDIAEQKGLTLTKLIHHLIDESGVLRKPNKDEIVDRRVNLSYLQELVSILKVKKLDEDGTIKSIVVNIKQTTNEPKPIDVKVEQIEEAEVSDAE